jgi:hypothetical protein
VMADTGHRTGPTYRWRAGQDLAFVVLVEFSLV